MTSAHRFSLLSGSDDFLEVTTNIANDAKDIKIIKALLFNLRHKLEKFEVAKDLKDKEQQVKALMAEIGNLNMKMGGAPPPSFHHQPMMFNAPSVPPSTSPLKRGRDTTQYTPPPPPPSSYYSNYIPPSGLPYNGVNPSGFPSRRTVTVPATPNIEDELLTERDSDNRGDVPDLPSSGDSGSGNPAPRKRQVPMVIGRFFNDDYFPFLTDEEKMQSVRDDMVKLERMLISGETIAGAVDEFLTTKLWNVKERGIPPSYIILYTRTYRDALIIN